MGIALSGNKKETLTDTEIIERARLLGMVMEDEAPEPSNLDSSPSADPADQEQDEQKNPAETEDSQDTESPEEAEDSQGTDTVEPDSEAQNNTTEQDNYMEEVVKIEIKAGEYSDVVCQKLYQEGLIQDAEEFNQYLTQKGADASIRVGVHQIPRGSSQDEIIRILQEKAQ